MGKKRVRIQTTGRRVPGPQEAPHHDQTLVEDVREVRDVEFAASKKEVARAKRRRLSEEAEDAAIRREAQAVKKAARSAKRSQVKKIDARREGLLMWKRAAELRRQRAKSSIDDPVEKKLQTEDLDEDGVSEHVLEKGKVDSRTSEKILEEARQQRKEIRKEELKSNHQATEEKNYALARTLHDVGEEPQHTKSLVQESDDEESEDDDVRSLAHTDVGPISTFGDDEDEQDLDFLDGTKITEEEELALSMFGGNAQTNNEGNNVQDDGQPKIMLADIILQKIREKEEADMRAAAIAADPERAARDKKIGEVYGLVGNIMSKYRNGKVPKAFKVISKLSNWEDIMYLTRPDEWTPAAVYVATRLFASNLTAKQVVRFYTDILLPRCLEDIAENKKLNYHLYRSLGKAVYKPDAFNKGILFPLCEDSSCTLRQASIIGSVISNVSIPMLHSAAALLYLSQLPYNTTTTIVMTALLEKKYALPYRVIDGMVESFVKMKQDPRPLPLIWHKCLLAFAQRYKMELTFDQKEKLKVLMRVQTHHAVTPEIRRELFSSKNRGDVVDPDANTIAKNIANAAVMMDV